MTLELEPTFHGYILSNEDALHVVEAALASKLPLVYRRPLDSERPHLIRLGNVFVFIEETSEIKRWTDGISWSASRILGRFLIYRKLDRGAMSNKGEKHRAKVGSKKRKSSKHSAVSSEDDLDYRRSNVTSASLITDMYSHYDNIEPQNSRAPEPVKASMGNHWRPLSPESPVSISQDRGLIKKTLSLAISANDYGTGKPQTVHLISYFCAHDVIAGNLVRPSETELKDAEISPMLWLAIRKSSLGGKLLNENEANFYLDDKYQLQNMSSFVRGDRIYRHFGSDVQGKFANEPPRRYSSVYSADSFKGIHQKASGEVPLGYVFRPPHSAPVETSYPSSTGMPQHFFPENELNVFNHKEDGNSRKKRKSSKPNLATPYFSSTDTLNSETHPAESHYPEHQVNHAAMHTYIPQSLHHPNFGEGYKEFKAEAPMISTMFSGGPVWTPSSYSVGELARGHYAVPSYLGAHEENAGRCEYESYYTSGRTDPLNNRAFGTQVSQQPHQKPLVFNHPQQFAHLPPQRWDFYSNNSPPAIPAVGPKQGNEYNEYESHGIYE